MPMTLWGDIVGYTCLWCGKWATHFYSGPYDPICCACHTGEKPEPGVLDWMEAKAIEMNTRFQKGLSLEDASVPLELDLDLDEEEERDYEVWDKPYESWVQLKERGE